MPTLSHQQHQLELLPHESVLDCLLRHGIALSYACKAGMCQACLVKAVDCTASEESRKWIKADLQAKGYTLACKWLPECDVRAELPNRADFAVRATIARLEPLNPQVKRLMLNVADPRRMFAYRPGQYLNATNPPGVTRAYSIANDFAVDGHVELHIGATSHGEFTHWLWQQAREGDQLFLSGPVGNCHYETTDDSDAPLLLAAVGTGLAPLIGIVNDALRQGHTQPIHLYHGGRSLQQLYLVDELTALAAQHKNFHYHPCVMETGQTTPVALQYGRLEPLLIQDMAKAKLAGFRIYLCGSPGFVHGLRKKLYLAGARSEHIHCDPFTERVVAHD